MVKKQKVEPRHVEFTEEYATKLARFCITGVNPEILNNAMYIEDPEEMSSNIDEGTFSINLTEYFIKDHRGEDAMVPNNVRVTRIVVDGIRYLNIFILGQTIVNKMGRIVGIDGIDLFLFDEAGNRVFVDDIQTPEGNPAVVKKSTSKSSPSTDDVHPDTTESQN